MKHNIRDELNNKKTNIKRRNFFSTFFVVVKILSTDLNLNQKQKYIPQLMIKYKN